MSNYRIIAKNIFSNWVNIVVTAVIGFFMMPFLVHRLGDTLYGIWILIVSLTGYGVLLDFGIRSSIVKYASQYTATNDKTNLNKIFNTSLAIYSITGIILMLIAIIFAQFLPYFFNISLEHMGDAKLVFLIVCLNMAFKFPCGVFEGFLCGIQRYDITNGISIFAALLKAIAIFIFLVSGYKLVTLSLVMLATDMVANCLMVVFSFKHLPFLRLDLRSMDGQMLKSIYRFGLYSFIIIIASKLIYESDAIIIGASLSAQTITLFAIANNLTRYLRQISYGFGNVFNPAASEFEAKNEHGKIEGLVINGTKYSLLIILPIAMTLIFLGKEFISLWMGNRYAELTGTVLIILTISQVIAMAQFSSGSILYGLNKHRYLAYLLILESAVKIALSIALIRKYGIIGLAVATAIPEILVYLIVFPRYVCRVTGLPLLKYFKEAFYPPLVSVLPFVCFIYLFKIFLESFSWKTFIATIAIGLLVYGATCLVICFNERQRNAIGGVFVNAFKRVVNNV